jgi:hypothetical protein
MWRQTTRLHEMRRCALSRRRRVSPIDAASITISIARKPRLDYPGCWHHLMHRGARREPIFREDSHRRLFLRYLSEACERTGLEVLYIGPGEYAPTDRSAKKK